MSFKSFLKEEEIVPSTIPGTMSLWHGGRLDDSYKETISQAKGRYEYGPGLYLITHYDTAKKYAKGSRRLYLITIKKGNDLNDVQLSKESVLEFVNNYVIKSKRKEVLARMEKYLKETMNADNFLNIIINSDAIQSTNTQYLRKFLIDNKVDYCIVKNAFGWDATMVVLFNMDLIVSKKVVEPKDKIKVFDLPTNFS